MSANLSEAEKDEEEDWELLMNSLPRAEGNERKKGLENKKLEEPLTDQEKTEGDDWYKTIPATPTNTPEHRTNPPAFPSAQKAADPGDFPPIREDAAEEGRSSGENADNEYSPDATDDEEHTSKKASWLLLIGFGVLRVLGYLLVFNVIKRYLPKIWRWLENDEDTIPNGETKI